MFSAKVAIESSSSNDGAAVFTDLVNVVTDADVEWTFTDGHDSKTLLIVMEILFSFVWFIDT